MHSVIVYLFKNFASTKRTPGTTENMKKLEAEIVAKSCLLNCTDKISPFPMRHLGKLLATSDALFSLFEALARDNYGKHCRSFKE